MPWSTRRGAAESTGSNLTAGTSPAQNAEARAVMAEEQLAVLQRYLAAASVTYQREIVRLKSELAAGADGRGGSGAAPPAR